MKFDVYSKKLNENKSAIEPNEIVKEAENLFRFFNEARIIFPTDKKANNLNQSTNNGGYELTTLENKEPTSPIGIIKTAIKDKMSQKDLTKSKNWMMFASYAYDGMKTDEVLFTPTISFIHLS